MKTIYEAYNKSTPKKQKLIDGFIVFNIILSLIQLAYEKLVTDYPFNSFLAGFFCTMGTASLTACLRVQLGTSEKSE